MSLVSGIYESPLGPVHFTLIGGALAFLGFSVQEPQLAARMVRRFGRAPVFDAAASRAVWTRLDRYFKGDLGALDHLAVDAEGTAFQARVWAALRSIPAGSLRSYGDIARVIGSPSAVRAVGAANGRNPVGLVVPCHRVIGAGGALTGYAGGIERKKWLIDHERAHAGQRDRAQAQGQVGSTTFQVEVIESQVADAV
jgi:O-6-methylguanine DNA methyltransferase